MHLLRFIIMNYHLNINILLDILFKSLKILNKINILFKYHLQLISNRLNTLNNRLQIKLILRINISLKLIIIIKEQ